MPNTTIEGLRRVGQSGPRAYLLNTPVYFFSNGIDIRSIATTNITPMDCFIVQHHFY